MSLKYASINIEGHRHFAERLLPFLKQERPEFISLQEVFASDVPTLKAELGMEGQFWPMANIFQTSMHFAEALGEWGVLQLTNLPIKTQGHAYYQGKEGEIPEMIPNTDPNNVNRVLAWMTVIKDDQEYTLATTHFIWTPHGDPSPLQHEKLAALWPILDTLPPYVVTGDFNAPRGRAIFTELASRLKDNIPQEVTTSIDGDLHKAGNLQLMVDGFFSTPAYEVSQVRVEAGVSDHKALVGEIQRLA